MPWMPWMASWEMHELNASFFVGKSCRNGRCSIAMIYDITGGYKSQSAGFWPDIWCFSTIIFADCGQRPTYPT